MIFVLVFDLNAFWGFIGWYLFIYHLHLSDGGSLCKNIHLVPKIFVMFYFSLSSSVGLPL